jgi:predicted GIY-YIG superfamily endonuclease
MTYWVYILQSETNGRHYIGHTDNLERRLSEHNDPNYSGSKTTKRFKGPWKAIWTHKAATRSEANQRGEKLGLTDDEVAFYDALEVNDSAVAVLGDETLRLIAQELVKAVRDSITIDWTVRENVRAQMRVIIKRILRKYGYPPDKQAHATELVLEQA